MASTTNVDKLSLDSLRTKFLPSLVMNRELVERSFPLSPLQQQLKIPTIPALFAALCLRPEQRNGFTSQQDNNFARLQLYFHQETLLRAQTSPRKESRARLLKLTPSLAPTHSSVAAALKLVRTLSSFTIVDIQPKRKGAAMTSRGKSCDDGKFSVDVEHSSAANGLEEVMLAVPLSSSSKKDNMLASNDGADLMTVTASGFKVAGAKAPVDPDVIMRELLLEEELKRAKLESKNKVGGKSQNRRQLSQQQEQEEEEQEEEREEEEEKEEEEEEEEAQKVMDDEDSEDDEQEKGKKYISFENDLKSIVGSFATSASFSTSDLDSAGEWTQVAERKRRQRSSKNHSLKQETHSTLTGATDKGAGATTKATLTSTSPASAALSKERTPLIPVQDRKRASVGIQKKSAEEAKSPKALSPLNPMVRPFLPTKQFSIETKESLKSTNGEQLLGKGDGIPMQRATVNLGKTGATATDQEDEKQEPEGNQGIARATQTDVSASSDALKNLQQELEAVEERAVKAEQKVKALEASQEAEREKNEICVRNLQMRLFISDNKISELQDALKNGSVESASFDKSAPQKQEAISSSSSDASESSANTSDLTAPRTIKGSRLFDEVRSVPSDS